MYAIRSYYGYLGLERLGGGAPDARHAWLLAQRAFYRQFLDGIDFPDMSGVPPLPAELREALASYNFV